MSIGALGVYLGLTGVQIRGTDALYAKLADVYLPPAAARARRSRTTWQPWNGAMIRRRTCGNSFTPARPAAILENP